MASGAPSVTTMQATLAWPQMDLAPIGPILLPTSAAFMTTLDALVGSSKRVLNGVGNTKTVNYPNYDDDGKLLRMFVTGASPAYDYIFSYDNMGRFEKIFVTGNPNVSSNTPTTRLPMRRSVQLG